MRVFGSLLSALFAASIVPTFAAPVIFHPSFANEANRVPASPLPSVLSPLPLPLHHLSHIQTSAQPSPAPNTPHILSADDSPHSMLFSPTPDPPSPFPLSPVSPSSPSQSSSSPDSPYSIKDITPSSTAPPSPIASPSSSLFRFSQPGHTSDAQIYIYRGPQASQGGIHYPPNPTQGYPNQPHSTQYSFRNPQNNPFLAGPVSRAPQQGPSGASGSGQSNNPFVAAAGSLPPPLPTQHPSPNPPFKSSPEWQSKNPYLSKVVGTFGGKAEPPSGVWEQHGNQQRNGDVISDGPVRGGSATLCCKRPRPVERTCAIMK